MISILTPTYNRGKYLPRLLDSLQAQNNYSFEWLVVDDGSNDGTRQLINSYIHNPEIGFNIRYFSQKNQGKHVALNYGANLCKHEWILILDSDDWLDPNAIDTIINKIQKNITENVVGFCFRRSLGDATLIGQHTSLPDLMVLTPLEASFIFKGDLAYVFHAEKMKAHKFPVIPGEKFFSELYIWNKISDEGIILYYPDISIYFCEYLSDGLTHNFKKIFRENPRGYFIYYLDMIKRSKKIDHKIKYTIRTLQSIAYCFLKS